MLVDYDQKNTVDAQIKLLIGNQFQRKPGALKLDTIGLVQDRGSPKVFQEQGEQNKRKKIERMDIIAEEFNDAQYIYKQEDLKSLQEKILKR